MTATQQDRARFALQPPRSLLGRIGFALAVAALAALAFFFLVIFLVVGAVLVAIFLVRWWWQSRKARTASAGSAIEGEYIVVASGGNDADAPGRPGALTHHTDRR